jgi:hypothetical protein
MDATSVEVRWDGLESGSTELCTVLEASDGVRAAGTVRGPVGACTYTLTADARWQFRTLTVRLRERSLEVAYDGAAWTVDGRARPDLGAAREVDLAVSPLTNALPIRRLRLAVGRSADITTAYVAVPDLTVVADPQRYTRLGPREYRYESRDSDFARTLTVDERGLVVAYPGLFVRAAG